MNNPFSNKKERVGSILSLLNRGARRQTAHRCSGKSVYTMSEMSVQYGKADTFQEFIYMREVRIPFSHPRENTFEDAL